MKTEKKVIIGVALLASLILYLAGSLSGFFFSSYVQKQVNLEVQKIKEDVDISALDIKNIQLQELILGEIDDCAFSKLHLERLIDRLSPYWETLPQKIEQYELSGNLDAQYLATKIEFSRLAIRVWAVALHNNDLCADAPITPVLLFYDENCEACVIQGEQFDLLKTTSEEKIVVLPIDVSLEEDSIYLLKTYYNITQTPAFLLEKKIYVGNYSVKELEELFS